MAERGTVFVNRNELLPEQQKYFDDMLASQKKTAEIVHLCTCLHGGPGAAESRKTCPIHKDKL